MALKFWGTFASTLIAGAEDFGDGKIEIFDEDFSGVATEICLSVPTLSEAAKEVSETGYGVLDCKYDLKVIGTDAINAKQLYITNTLKSKVILTRMDTSEVVLTGYLVADDVTQAYEDRIRVVNVGIIDGLEVLKNEEFEINGVGKRATGTKTILDIITYCLSRTRLELNIVTSYPYFRVGELFDEEYCTFAETMLHSDIFNELNCYEVLQRICSTLNVKIFQKANEWYVVHAFPYDNIPKYYQKFDFEGTFIEAGDYLTDVEAAHGDFPFQPSEGNMDFIQAAKEAITTLDIEKSNTNLLENGFFDDGGLKWVNWAEDHEVDSVAYGGLGTKKDPYYMQINGYQPTNLVDDRKIGGMRHAPDGTAGFITIMAEGDDPRETLDVSLRFSAKVKGKNVQKAYAEVILYIYLNDGGAYTGKVPMVLSEGGGLSLVRFPNLETVFSVIDGRKKHLDAAIGVSLVDGYNNNKSTYTSINEESISLLDVISQMNFFFERKTVFSGKYTIDDVVKIEGYVALTEGHGLKSSPTDSERWVRWAEVKLELVDKSRAVGLTKNKYISKLDNGAFRSIEKKAYFGDYYNPLNYTSMLKLDGSTTGIWTVSGLAEYDDLLMLLNKELISLNADAVQVYDGKILGYLPKDSTVELLEYDQRVVSVGWSYDFEGNFFEGRMVSLIESLVDSDDSKKGVFEGTSDGEEELDYTDQYPPTVKNEVASNSADVASLENMTANAMQSQSFGDGIQITVEEVEVSPDVFVLETRLSFFNPITQELIYQIGITEDNKIAFYNADGNAYVLDPTTIEGTEEIISTATTPKWIDYATGFSTAPSFVETIATGDVYSYLIKGDTETVYRLVPNSPTVEDAFYSTFVTPTLSDKIVGKWIV